MTKFRNYWMVTFTLKTWAESVAAGGNLVGFRGTTTGDFEKIAVGDYVLCYLIGVSRFVAVQEVKSETFWDDSPIWKNDDFPLRIKVKTIVQLEPETAVPIKELRNRLSIFKDTTNSRWGVHFRTSPKRWKREDGEGVVEALKEAARTPTKRPFQDHP